MAQFLFLLSVPAFAGDQSQTSAVRDETSNGSVIGRASMSGNVCGIRFDSEATGRRGLQFAKLYANCVSAEAMRIDAEGRATNTMLALMLNRDIHSEGDESATGRAAPISARTDDEGGAIGYGLGAGLPYGASPFGMIQSNAMGWQAVQAFQNMAPPVTAETVVPAPTRADPAATDTDRKKAAAAVKAVQDGVAAPAPEAN